MNGHESTRNRRLLVHDQPLPNPHVAEVPTRKIKSFRVVLRSFVVLSFTVLLVAYYIWKDRSLESLDVLWQGSPVLVGYSALSGVASSSSISIIKAAGDNWILWRSGMKPMFTDRESYQCDWVTYTPVMDHNSTMKICVHPEQDLISTTIRETGNWGDCVGVTRQWLAFNHTGSHHVEIGANIGACIIDLLLTTNANIVAFEPHPKNVFCLTSTLAANEVFAKRVTLFPIALGTEKTQMSLEVEQQANFGSSRIGNGDDTTQKTGDFKKTETIQVERLDDLIEGTAKLMKLDAQGFECNIMDGMSKLLSTVNRVFTEVEYDNLERAGCSGDGFKERFQNANFQLKRYRFTGLLEDLQASSRRRDFNMVACQKGDACE